MTETKVLNFREYFISKGYNYVLLEMGRPFHTERKKVEFDEDDIKFLEQFDRRYWKRALTMRYGKLLIEALKEREWRRMDIYKTIYNDYFTGKHSKDGIEGYDDFLRKNTQAAIDKGNDLHNETIQARIKSHSLIQARDNAIKWAQLETEKIPGYVHISPKFDTMYIEFPEGRADKANQRRSETFLVKTYLNNLVHRLETIEGHPRPDKTDPTIVGQIGYWLWGATHTEKGIPSHAGGMMALANDGSALMALSRWINAVADENLGKFDNLEGKLTATENDPDNPGFKRNVYKWKEDEGDDGKQDAGAKHTIFPEHAILMPIYKKFKELLEFYHDSPDHLVQSGMGEIKKVVDAKAPDGSQLVREPSDWRDNPESLKAHAKQLAWGYLWLKTAENNDPHEEIRKVKNQDAGATRVLYRLPDPTHQGKEPVIRLWRKKDGTFLLQAPNVSTLHKRANTSKVVRNKDGTIATNPDGSVQLQRPKADSWIPDLKPGKQTLTLPHDLWKKDATLRKYHSVLDYAGKEAHNRLQGAVPVNSEWYCGKYAHWKRLLAFNESTQNVNIKPIDQPNSQYFFEYEDEDDNNDAVNAGQEDDTSDEVEDDRPNYDELEKPVKKGRPTGNAKFDDSIDILHAHHGGYAHIGEHAFKFFKDETVRRPDNGMADYIELLKNGQVVDKIPTSGRFGETVAKKTNEDVEIAEYEKVVGAAGIAYAKQQGAKDHLAVQQQEFGNRFNNMGFSANKIQHPRTFYLKHLMEYAANNPATEEQARDNAQYISSFYNQLAERLLGGRSANHNSAEKHPLPFNSNEYNEVMKRVEEGMRVKPGTSVFQPIYDGVRLGLKRCESWYPGEITTALTSEADGLYSLGWTWLSQNLGSDKIMGVGNKIPEPDSVNTFIKNKVAQLVVDAGQQNLTGSGSRRTRGKATQSTDNDLQGKDGGVASARDQIGENAKLVFASRGLERGRGYKPIIKAAFDMNSQLDTIKQMVDKMRMEKQLSPGADVLHVMTDLSERLGGRIDLMKAIMDKIRNSPAGKALSDDQVTEQAKAEFYQYIKGLDPNFDIKAAQAITSKSANKEPDQDVQSLQIDRNAQAFKDLKKRFTSLDNVEKFLLRNKKFISLLVGYYKTDPQKTLETIRDLSTGCKSPAEQQEIYNLFTKQLQRSYQMLQNAETAEKEDIDRGADVYFHSTDDFVAKNSVKQMLEKPLDYKTQLLSPNKSLPPMEFLSLVDAQITKLTRQMHTAGKGAYDLADYDFLTHEVRPAANRIAASNTGGITDPNKTGVIPSSSISPLAIQAMLANLSPEHLAFLNLDQVLLSKNMADHIQQRIIQLDDALKIAKADKQFKEMQRIAKDLLTLKELAKKVRMTEDKRLDPNKKGQTNQTSADVDNIAYQSDKYEPIDPQHPFRVKGSPAWHTAEKNPSEMAKIILHDPRIDEETWFFSNIISQLPPPPKRMPFFQPHKDQDKKTGWGIHRYDPAEKNISPFDRKTAVKPVMATNLGGQERTGGVNAKGNMRHGADLLEDKDADLIPYLKQAGIDVEPIESMPVSMLLPSQMVSHLHQQTVMEAFNKGTIANKPVLVVSGKKDEGKYIIVDGHHVWAGNYGHLLRYGVDSHIEVYYVKTSFDTLWTVLKDYWQKKDPWDVAKDPRTGVKRNLQPEGPGFAPQSTTSTGGVKAGVAPPQQTFPTAPPITQATAQPTGPDFNTMINDPTQHATNLQSHMRGLPPGHQDVQTYNTMMKQHYAQKNYKHHKTMYDIWRNTGLNKIGL